MLVDFDAVSFIELLKTVRVSSAKKKTHKSIKFAILWRKNIIFDMRGPHRNHEQHSIGTGRGPQRSNQNMAPSYKGPLKAI